MSSVTSAVYLLAQDPWAGAPGPGDAGAFGGGADLLANTTVMLAILGVAVVMYVYTSTCLMITAQKTNTPNSWMAWFPVLNLFLATAVGRLSAIWAVMAFLPCIQIIAFPMIISGIATARGKPGWLAVLFFVPGLNLLLPAILAMGPASNTPSPSYPNTSPPYGAGPPVAGGPRHCPACGAVNKPNAAFCGNCGQGMPVAAPVHAHAGGMGAPPQAASAKSSSAMGCLMVLLLGGGALMAGCCGVGAYFYYIAPGTYTAPARKAPQVPQGVAGTRIAFPRDSAGVNAARPTTTVSQTVRRGPDGNPKMPVEIPQSQLPQGVTSQSLAGQARSVTSATYRPTSTAGPGSTGSAPGPAVNVHAIEPENPGAAANLVEQVRQANPGSQVEQDGLRTSNGEDYARWRIAAGQTVTIIMQSTSQPIVIILYAPTQESVPIMDRLSSNVGNSQGLNNPEEIACIEILPAFTPPEFVLEAIWTWSKAETDPAAFTQGTQGDPELREFMQAIYAALPDLLTVAWYSRGEQMYVAVICNYSQPNNAYLMWSGINWTLGTQATSKPKLSGTDGLMFQSDSAVAAFRKGPYVVFLMAENPQDGGLLQQLADALQL